MVQHSTAPELNGQNPISIVTDEGCVKIQRSFMIKFMNKLAQKDHTPA